MFYKRLNILLLVFLWVQARFIFCRVFTLSERHCLKVLEILIMGPSGRVNPTRRSHVIFIKTYTFLYISGTLPVINY